MRAPKAQYEFCNQQARRARMVDKVGAVDMKKNACHKLGGRSKL
jgi:hypothetical protein